MSTGGTTQKNRNYIFTYSYGFFNTYLATKPKNRLFKNIFISPPYNVINNNFQLLKNL